MIHCDKCTHDGYTTKAEFSIVITKFVYKYKDNNNEERSFFTDANPRVRAYVCQPCLKFTKETNEVQFTTELL